MVDEEPLGGCATFESYMYLFMYLPVFSILQNSVLTLMRVYLLFLTEKTPEFFSSRIAWVNNARTMAIYGDAASIT